MITTDLDVCIDLSTNLRSPIFHRLQIRHFMCFGCVPATLLNFLFPHVDYYYLKLDSIFWLWCMPWQDRIGETVARHIDDIAGQP
ncbi:hypothetical protein N826_36490 [Skermanella aerolata KACC 11604]|nr:hypothetical protein N826_36490 [Skermanella aerolata KACC 11604]